MTIQPPRKVERLFERRRLVLALAGSGALGALGALAACGGGSVADTPPDETLNQPLGVGAGGTGLRWDSVITGRVAQLRPVAVGGVALTTLGATLSDGDGQRLDDNDIEIGMTTRGAQAMRPSCRRRWPPVPWCGRYWARAAATAFGPCWPCATTRCVRPTT